jgi:hypothetical protein
VLWLWCWCAPRAATTTTSNKNQATRRTSNPWSVQQPTACTARASTCARPFYLRVQARRRGVVSCLEPDVPLTWCCANERGQQIAKSKKLGSSHNPSLNVRCL